MCIPQVDKNAFEGKMRMSTKGVIPKRLRQLINIEV